MNKKYENVLLVLYFINWIISISFGCIGIYNLLGSSILANIISLVFWISSGYIHMRAYSDVIEDYNNKHNKKQP